MLVYKLYAIHENNHDYIEKANKYCPDNLITFLINEGYCLATGKEDIVRTLREMLEVIENKKYSEDEDLFLEINNIMEVYNNLDEYTGSYLYTLQYNDWEYHYKAMWYIILCTFTFPKEFENYTDDDLQLVLELK